MKESDLYEPMRQWLQQYLIDKYKGYEIITEDTSLERLDRALARHGVSREIANGIDVQIDVLGIAKRNLNTKIFFIEAKKTRLTLRDLGQLWAYCKLIDPDEAFLLTSEDLGSLNKLLNVFHREDLLDFGDKRTIKKMKVGRWDVKANSVDWFSIVPKL